MPCAQTRGGGACSTPAPSGAFTSRSTMATTGNRCASICRRARCATSSCTTATWSSRRMAARSGSWTTSRRYARSPPPGRRAAPSCTGRLAPCAAAGPITLEILDRAGRIVRRFASDDRPESPDTTVNIPLYWIRSPQTLSTTAGMHRFVWDLHYPPPPALRREYPISAIRGDTPREPRGPWVLPGSYTVRLSAGGDTLTQPLAVRMDPRVRLAPGVLAQQFALATRLVAAMRGDSVALERVRALRTQLKGARERLGQGAWAAADSLDARAAALESGAGEPPSAGARQAENLTRLNGDLVAAYGVVEGADAAPTTAARAAVGDLERALGRGLARLRELEGRFRSVARPLQ